MPWGRRKQPQIPTYLACSLLLCPGAQAGTAVEFFLSAEPECSEEGWSQGTLDMGTQVGYREGREMLTRAVEAEPNWKAPGLKNEEILVRGMFYWWTEPGHGEMPMALLCAQNIQHISNKFPSTNGKNILWFPCLATGDPEICSEAQPSSTSCNLPFKARPPPTQRLRRFQLSFQFKNRMFPKASLVGQTCQSGCKKFHVASNTPALDQESEELCSRLRAPCPCKQQAVSEMIFTPSCVPSSAFPGLGSQPLMCFSRTARKLQQCYHHSPPALPPRQRQPSWPHLNSNLPAQSFQQHPEHVKAWGPDPAVHSGVLHRVGASPIMCLAPWSSLPRAAYVLTGRNTGKQLASSDPVVSQQESIQMPIPPFHGKHPHFQMCLAGVKFKLHSGAFIHILVSYFVLKPSMCHSPHITFGKTPIRLSTGLPSSLSLTTC